MPVTRSTSKITKTKAPEARFRFPVQSYKPPLKDGEEEELPQPDQPFRERTFHPGADFFVGPVRIKNRENAKYRDNKDCFWYTVRQVRSTKATGHTVEDIALWANSYRPPKSAIKRLKELPQTPMRDQVIEVMKTLGEHEFVLWEEKPVMILASSVRNLTTMHLWDDSEAIWESPDAKLDFWYCRLKCDIQGNQPVLQWVVDGRRDHPTGPRSMCTPGCTRQRWYNPVTDIQRWCTECKNWYHIECLEIQPDSAVEVAAERKYPDALRILRENYGNFTQERLDRLIGAADDPVERGEKVCSPRGDGHLILQAREYLSSNRPKGPVAKKKLFHIDEALLKIQQQGENAGATNEIQEGGELVVMYKCPTCKDVLI